MNTALLSGIPHSVPVKLVVVETGGAVYEVTEQMGCESSNKQVLQVRTQHTSQMIGFLYYIYGLANKIWFGK